MRYERAMAQMLGARTGALAYAGFRPCVLTPAWLSGSSRRGRVSRNWIAPGAGPRQPSGLRGAWSAVAGLPSGARHGRPFVWRRGRHCLSVPLPGRVRRRPPAPIPWKGAVRLVTRYQRRWVISSRLPANLPRLCAFVAARRGFCGANKREGKPNGHTGSRCLSFVPAIKIPI